MTKIGENIKLIRVQRELSQAALAERCGWDNASRISNYENTDREPALEDIKIIARALNVSPARLAFDDCIAANDVPYPEIKGIPVLNWENALDWPLNKKEITVNQFLGDKFVLNSNCYALQIKDDLMTSRYNEHSFKKGSYLIVDPSKKYKHEDFVIAKKEGVSDLLFRQFRSEAGYTYLMLLKDAHPKPNLDLTVDIKICGVVITQLEWL